MKNDFKKRTFVKYELVHDDEYISLKIYVKDIFDEEMSNTFTFIQKGFSSFQQDNSKFLMAVLDFIKNISSTKEIYVKGKLEDFLYDGENSFWDAINP